MSYTFSQNSLIALLLGMVRAGAWLALCPPFNASGTPRTVKALMAVAISLPMTDLVARSLPMDMSTPVLVGAMVQQVLVGAALGFVTALLFAAVQSAGSLIDLAAGFTVAFAYDPFSNTSNSVFGRFYGLTATTILFATDAHQMILAGFARSYRVLPPGSGLSLRTLERALTSGIGQTFQTAAQIAGPVVAVLFLADLALGLVSKVAPALNAFSLGYPAKILMTLAIAGMAMAVLPNMVGTLTRHSVDLVMGLVDASR